MMKQYKSILKTCVTLPIFSLLTNTSQLMAQTKRISTTDTAGSKYLPEITVVGRNSSSDIHQLPEIVGTNINAGKKNSLIVMDNVNGNVVTNTMRQVMAKVPGIHIWESDGSGIQIGISARGLSPNRSWEFNVRQNGYDISADPFGYPEAYYNPQLQAVQRIEVIRGQGSLQYGPQFGGMVNYILRNGGEINKPFQFETQQTVGSNSLFNSYNAIGGQTKKISYYTFFDHRNADGWRQNSDYYTNSAFGTLTYKASSRLSVTTEIMYSKQRSRQPGGLTDEQFNQDAKQSFRSRNWFDITWKTLAVIANYQISRQSRLNLKLFHVEGDRNSVGYLKAITVKDSINPATMEYNNRTLDMDKYRNTGFEARFLTGYSIGKMNSNLSAGIRLYHGNTHRLKDGVGTAGTGYSDELINPVWPKDITYKSFNAAVFAENIFHFNKLIIIPGIRYEVVNGKAAGRNGYDANGQDIILQNQKRSRGFLLAGVGAEHHVSEKTEFYGNITQAYRPMQFSDLTAPPTTDAIDPNLSDAKGYNIDLGYRGKVKAYLFFDVSAFYLRYNNRIGTITQQRTDGTFYNYRTNVGNSISKGIEALAEISFVKAFAKELKPYDISAFISYSHTDARYGNLKVIVKDDNGLKENNLKNKKVENAPENIVRSGITFSYNGFALTTQVSHVSSAFSDANNTETPTANGQIGLIPAYTVADITATWRWAKNYNIKAGVNNLANKKYFTRRAGGYPGPGVLPADGRSVFISFGAIF
jgi:Fe(3+) dicitrate transport protein